MSVEFQEFYAKDVEICLPGVLATFIYLLDSGIFEGPGIADGWPDYMVGEEQWVIMRRGTNIRRMPKRYTIWPWEIWVIHYVSVFQSDSSPQLWYRWEVTCESWKYYNINMIYMRALWISSLCFFRIIFVSFIWYSDLIRVFTGSHWWSIG